MSTATLEPDLLQRLTADADAVLDRVQRNCLLVTMRFRRWAGQYQIDGASVRLGDVSLDETTATAPRWKLLPDSWKKRFQTLESKARGAMQRYSVPFALHSVYIVPVSRAENLFAELRTIRDELGREAAEFVRSYDDLVTTLEIQMGQTFAAAAKNLPGREQLRERFGLSWAVVPLGGAGVGRGLDEQELSDYMSEARQEMNRLVMESVEAMVREPRQELADAVGNLADLIARKGVVRGGTLDRIKRAFDKLRSFEFMADAEILAQMKQVEGKLGGLTPQDLNANEQIAKGLAGVLRSLQDQCASEAAAVASFNKFTRGIDL